MATPPSLQHPTLLLCLLVPGCTTSHDRLLECLDRTNLKTQFERINAELSASGAFAGATATANAKSLTELQRIYGADCTDEARSRVSLIAACEDNYRMENDLPPREPAPSQCLPPPSKRPFAECGQIAFDHHLGTPDCIIPEQPTPPKWLQLGAASTMHPTEEVCQPTIPGRTQAAATSSAECKLEDSELSVAIRGKLKMPSCADEDVASHAGANPQWRGHLNIPAGKKLVISGSLTKSTMNAPCMLAVNNNQKPLIDGGSPSYEFMEEIQSDKLDRTVAVSLKCSSRRGSFYSTSCSSDAPRDKAYEVMLHFRLDDR
ncbi:MAG: hypothetical protein R3B72_38110 [Polyangiaceae bacterium]